MSEAERAMTAPAIVAVIVAVVVAVVVVVGGQTLSYSIAVNRMKVLERAMMPIRRR